MTDIADGGLRNVCRWVCFLAACYCAVIVFAQLGVGFSTPPPRPPQTGISFEGMVAFVKAAGAAFLAFAFGKSFVYIEVPPKPPTKHLEPQDIALLRDLSVTEERLVYHASVPKVERDVLTKYYVIGSVREGHKGTTPRPEFGKFWHFQDAQAKAKALNAQSGYGMMRAQRIVNRCLR